MPNPAELDPYSQWTEYLATRHVSVQHLVSLFEYGHLPEGKPRAISAMVTGTVIESVIALSDGPELAVGLRKLLEAKDCFVRQAIVDGREGLRDRTG